MAITLQCPRCTHEQKIDNDKIGKDVPCKICHHLIRAGGEPKAKSGLAPKQDASEQAVQAGVPGAVAGKKPPPTTEDRSAKKRKDRGDDDDRPVPRRPRDEQGASSSMAMMLVGGGILVLLAVMCGGGGLGVFLLFRSSPKPEEQVAAIEDPGPQNQNPVNNDFPQPGPNFQPPPAPPFQPPPPPPQVVDVDSALVALRGAEQRRAQAYEWLVNADPNVPRRRDVAIQLEKLVDEELRNPFTRFFDAYFRWITSDNVPSLIRFAESTEFSPGGNARRQKSMLALGKLKEGRAAENIASKLNNAFDGDAAQNALAEMGPIAQPVVLKHLNDRDGRVRERARKLLEGYGTKADAYFTQCLTDLDSGDRDRRGAATQWLAKAPVDAKRKPEIARTLNKLLDNPDVLRDNDLVACLETWGTRDNVPNLIRILDNSRLGNGAAIRILGKFDDPDALKAIGRGSINFFHKGEAMQVLKGRGIAGERAVIEAMNTTNDVNARRQFVHVLGEIGTMNVSGPALVQLAQRNPRDQALTRNVQQELKKIAARGK